MATGRAKPMDCRLVKVGALKLQDARIPIVYRSIAILSAESMIIVDYVEGNLRLYSCRNGTLLAISDQLSKPRDVCVLDDTGTKVAVTLEEGQIEILSVESKGLSISIRRLWILNFKSSLARCYGLGFLKSRKMLVVSGMKIAKDTQEYFSWGLVPLQDMAVGTINMVTISTVHEICKYEFDGRSYLATEDETASVYITCSVDQDSSYNGVYAFDIMDGRKKFAYCRKDLQNLNGISVDKKGFIYVCNRGLSCIYQLTKSLELVTVHLEGIPPQILAMCMDTYHRELYVTSFGSAEVWRLQPEWGDQRGDHIASVVLMIDEGKDSVFEEISTQIGHGLPYSAPTDVMRSTSGLLEHPLSTSPTYLPPQNKCMDTVEHDSDIYMSPLDTAGFDLGRTCYSLELPRVRSTAQKHLKNVYMENVQHDSGIYEGKSQSYVEEKLPTSIQLSKDSEDDKEEGSHKYSEVIMSAEKKQPIIVESSIEIEQENEEKGRSNKENKLSVSIQLPKDFEDDKQDHNPEKDICFIECIKGNDFRKIGLLLKNRMVPSKNIIISAIKEHGYNKGIQCLLRGMSNRLRKDILHASHVWCGYKMQDPHTPVFVVMFSKQTSIPKEMKFSIPYDDYEIVFRNEHTPNEEEENISEQSDVNAKTIDKENIARVLDCIARNTERLMNEHSKLSIIAASTIKAMGFNEYLSELTLRQSLCIVLYVPVKGIIPVGEKEFPKDIDGISIDVREGEFLFHGRKKAHKWHPNLRMGCRISTKDGQYGTLGGFVDLPGGKIGCITAAHVVLNKTERKNYVKFKKTKKARYNASLAKGHSVIEIYQPTRRSAAFGKVSQIAFEEGNKSTPSVDAAVIEITDADRTPNTGIFPSGNYPAIGFTNEKPMMYTSGKTRDHLDISRGSRVVKYGCSTNITHGKLVWNGASVRSVDTVGKSWNRLKADNIFYPKFFNQMVVKSSDKSNFSVPGDSGALVFMYRRRNRDLEAIGLLIGGSTHRSSVRMHIVTPIQTVFQQLGLGNIMFKGFPDVDQGEQNLAIDELIYSRQRPDTHHGISDQNIYELKEEIKEAAKLEIKEEIKEAIKSEIKEEIQEMQEAVKANTASLEQIKEEMKSNTSSLEQTIIRLLSKPAGDADQS